MSWPQLGRLLRRSLAWTWASPYTAPGLALGLVMVLAGARMRLREGAVEFGGGALGRLARRLPARIGFSAITLGHVILGLDAATLDAVRAHEQVHVRQYERWGLLFGPAYLLSSLVQLLRGGRPYLDNAFEREAYGHAAQGARAQPRRDRGECPATQPVAVASDPPRTRRVAMKADDLRAVQAPLKERYRTAPQAAHVTLRAEGRLAEGVSCKIETGKGLVTAGLHPATGGSGLQACSGDMLLEALVACAGVTLGAVATALGIELRDASLQAEGDLDFRGTLGVSKEAPVGFRAIRLQFTLDTDAPEDQVATLLRLTERYCVVFQTLAHPPALSVVRAAAR